MVVTTSFAASISVDFEGVDTASGQVSGTAVTSYLRTFGISAPTRNVLTGGDGRRPTVLTLAFDTPVSNVSFIRAGTVGQYSPSGTIAGPWAATAYEAAGNAIATEGEELTSFFGDRAPVRFTLGSSAIARVAFAGDDLGHAGINTPFVTNMSFQPTQATEAPNYSDIWWNPAESGWGLTVADHETNLFAVWYTYRQDGSPTWFVIPGGTFSQDRRLFSGSAYKTTGPPFSAPFTSRPVTVQRVGSVTLDFAPPGLAAGTALFSYDIEGVTGSKQIERQPFGNAPSRWGTDLTELWWDPSESGWGLSINQHGNNVFTVWYTYDASGEPLFVVMPGAVFAGAATFTGELYTTRGPYFGGPFAASQVQVIPFGDATVDFSTAGTASVAPKIWNPKSGKTKIRTRDGQVFNKTLKQQRYGYDAPSTPATPCNATYGAWSACAADGFQSRLRIATDPPGCPSEPYEFRPCAAPAACTYTYTPWSECQNGTRTRQVASSSPAGCTGTPEPLTEQCTPPTLCSYTIGAWSGCVNGLRTRSVTPSPPGCTPNNPPPASESCTSGGAIRQCAGTFSASVASGPYCGPASFSGQIRLESENLAATGTRPLRVVLNPGVHFCDGKVYEWVEDLNVTFSRDAAGAIVTNASQGDNTYRFAVEYRAPAGTNANGTVSLEQFVPGFPQYNWKWAGTFSCSPSP